VGGAADGEQSHSVRLVGELTALTAADQCALLVPMDTTKMIGATDDQSHRHKV